KRIEESNRLLVRAVLGTPHALRYVLALAEPLRAGEVRVRALVADEGEEDAETEPAAEDLRLRRRFLAQLGRVRRLVAARDTLARGLVDRRREHARLAQGRARLEARLLGALCGLGLSRRQIERVASGLYAGVERVGRRRAQLQAVERRTGRSAAELLRMTRGLARGGESGEPSRPERAALEQACQELRVPHETLVSLAEENRGTPRDRRSGAHDPYPRAHGGDHQQADPHRALPGAGDGPRADAGGDRRAHGHPRRQGAAGHEDRQGADLARDADRRGGGLERRRLH